MRSDFLAAVLRRPASMPLCLALLTAAVHANSLLNGFTIDDVYLYSDNGFVRCLANLRHLFGVNYFQFSNEASYRPVCTATYFLDAALWGQGTVGPHLTNVVLMVGLVLTLFAFYRRLHGDPLAAFLGAALFALHPVNTEVVSAIGFREDLLVGLLLPASWILYRRGSERSPRVGIGLAWLAYALALFSKESAIVFPALVLILDRPWLRAGQPLPPPRRHAAAYLAGLVACSVFFLLVRFVWLRFPAEAAVPRLGGTLAGTLLADVRIQARYVLLFLWPFNLRALYPPAAYAPRVDLVFAGSAALLVAVAVAFIVWRRHRLFTTAWLWWYVALAPVANVYPIFNPMAERYLFLPNVGACLLAGWLSRAALRTRWRAVALAAAALVAVAFAARVVTRNPVWRDNLALWGATARVVPDDPTVVANLASALYEKRRYAEAEAAARRALRLTRETRSAMDLVPVRLALGSALFMRGDLDSALAEFQFAESRLPCRFDIDAAVYRNLGLIHDQRGDLAAALAAYRKSVAADPFRADVHRKSSYCLLRQGDLAAARADWDRARGLDSALPPFDEILALYRRSREAGR